MTDTARPLVTHVQPIRAVLFDFKCQYCKYKPLASILARQNGRPMGDAGSHVTSCAET
jgi:hypothetical protein